MTCRSGVVAKPAKPVDAWRRAGKTWDSGSGFRVLASAKWYSHSLNSFLLEKADLICDFQRLDWLSALEAMDKMSEAHRPHDG
jgi:hypothetical protein